MREIEDSKGHKLGLPVNHYFRDPNGENRDRVDYRWRIACRYRRARRRRGGAKPGAAQGFLLERYQLELHALSIALTGLGPVIHELL